METTKTIKDDKIKNENVIRRTLSIPRMKDLLADGYSVSEIARIFSLPERIIRDHIEEANNYKP